MPTEEQEASYKSSLVRLYRRNQPIGVGFHIQDGYLLTCAHVVSQALLGKKDYRNLSVEDILKEGDLVDLDFPFLVDRNLKKARLVSLWWRIKNEDIAILKLEEAFPEGLVSSPIRSSNYYRDHDFYVFGFPDGHLANGLEARGKLFGGLVNRRVQMEGITAQGEAIEPGFSGSPVWDEELNTIAGMTVSRDKDREEAKISFMIPHTQLEMALDAISLLSILLPQEREVLNYIRDASRRYIIDSPDLEQFGDLESTIFQLLDLPHGEGYRPIEFFVAYLISKVDDDPLKARLEDWLRSPGRVAELEAVLSEVATQIEEETKPKKHHLLFWIQRDRNSDNHSIKAYLIEDGESYKSNKKLNRQLETPDKHDKDSDQDITLPQIKDILRKCLDESVGLLPSQGGLPSIRVEVFAPLEQLGLRVEHWPADEKTIVRPVPAPIGGRYTLVLRIAERLDKMICTPQFKALWKQKWSYLEKSITTTRCKGLVCGDGSNGKILSPEELCDELCEPTSIGLYFSQLPEDFSEHASSLFPILIGTGTPVAIWPQEDVSSCDRAWSDFLSCCLSELPSKVKELRAESHRRENRKISHIGRHIGLIWEDPYMIPPVEEERRFRMAMP